MRIIIFEQDYSDINTIHNSIYQLAKLKEYTIYQVLTTRKPQSILNYLDAYQADSFFISIRHDQPETFALARQIRNLDYSAQIVLITDKQTPEVQTLAQQLHVTQLIEKRTKATLERHVEEAFSLHYHQYHNDFMLLKKSIS